MHRCVLHACAYSSQCVGMYVMCVRLSHLHVLYYIVTIVHCAPLWSCVATSTWKWETHTRSYITRIRYYNPSCKVETHYPCYILCDATRLQYYIKSHKKHVISLSLLATLNCRKIKLTFWLFQQGNNTPPFLNMVCRCKHCKLLYTTITLYRSRIYIRECRKSR